MHISMLLNDWKGFIVALAALLSGVAALLRSVKALSKQQRTVKVTKSAMAKRAEAIARWRAISSIAVAVSLVMVGFGIFITRIVVAQNQPLSVRLIEEAWRGLQGERWNVVIGKTDECINEFGGQAERQQAALVHNRSPLPPLGTVSDEEKLLIWRQGPLNDVGTAYFIRAKALERVGRNREAKQSYESAAKLTYARCWDTQGWFWSPAEAAADRLKFGSF